MSKRNDNRTAHRSGILHLQEQTGHVHDGQNFLNVTKVVKKCILQETYHARNGSIFEPPELDEILSSITKQMAQ